MQICLQIVRKCQWWYIHSYGANREKKKSVLCELTPFHFKSGLGGFLQKYALISRHSLLIEGEVGYMYVFSVPALECKTISSASSCGWKQTDSQRVQLCIRMNRVKEKSGKEEGCYSLLAVQ